jgi:hypothetical protein
MRKNIQGREQELKKKPQRKRISSFGAKLSREFLYASGEL